MFNTAQPALLKNAGLCLS